MSDNHNADIPNRSITAFRNNYTKFIGNKINLVEFHGINNYNGKKYYTYYYIDKYTERVDENRLKKDFNDNNYR